ncbi:hypothetical protein MVEN_01808600 [Mycena venus]|uniref:Uncharacterized protein n=1 Tax=Mycena venus TaxID=2733690 RepID=A0A8H7CNA2_9AGAR|nr:hypothetical protein MVEN_01808600 [Mycena venus]
MSSLNGCEKENTLIGASDAMSPSVNQSHFVASGNDQHLDKLTEMHGASGGTSNWPDAANHAAESSTDYNEESPYDQLLPFNFPHKSPSPDTAHKLALSYERVAQWIPGTVNNQDEEMLSPFECVNSSLNPLLDRPLEPSHPMIIVIAQTRRAPGTPNFPRLTTHAPSASSYECPNVTGEYDCPYTIVYEVSESARYDPYVRYGYEHLPRSSNPRGWTFENTGGCRLYGLGLKSLAPMNNGTEDFNAVQDIELQVLGEGGKDELDE